MQGLDPLANYTDAEVDAALTFRSGTRAMSYRYDLLDELNRYLSPLDNVLKGSVELNTFADIKRTAKLSMIDRGSVNFLKHRVQPWARLAMPGAGEDLRPGYVEWPLGVFLLSTPKRVLSSSGVTTREVECYDQLLVLTDDKSADRYSIAAGTKYTDAVGTAAFGFASSIIPSALTLPAAMEWEPGTSKLRIVNDLLAAINYEPASFDERGVLVCRPYLSPADRTPVYNYAAGRYSIIGGDVAQELDLFGVANKWVLVKSEADSAPLVATYTNTSAASPTSTVSRGRTITDVRTESDAANLATLQAKAARLAFAASQVYERVTFSTAAMPFHGNGDVLGLAIPGLALDAKFGEVSWRLPLEPGAAMIHEARRVVVV